MASRCSRFLLVTAMAGTAAVFLSAQAPPQFAVRTDVVRLDVSVLDSAQSPIRGLTAADFVIREDGKDRPITTFVEINLPDTAAAGPSWMRDTAPDITTNDISTEHRLLVLVLDDAMIPQSLPAFVESAKVFGRGLVDRLGPRDVMAVVYTRDVRKTQSFTRDRTRLRATIDALVGGQHEPTELLNSMTSMSEKARGLETLRSLNSVVERLGTIPDRRKAVVFVSPGIPVDPLVITPGAKPGDPAFQIVSDMKELFRRAERANVNFYTVDPGGVDGMRSIFDRRAAQFRFEVERREAEEAASRLTRLYRDFLRTMADYSGGRAFAASNDAENGLTQLVRETGHYYLVGYEPANPRADGRFRRVEARVVRTGATVRARRGYFAERPARDVLPPPSVVTALEGLLPQSALPLVAAASPFASTTPGTATVAIALGLPAPPADAPSDRVAVLLAAFDDVGTERASQKMTTNVALPKGTPEGATYEVVASLDLAPGRYELRLSADSGARRSAGSVYVDVVVPDFSKEPLSLSGVVVSREPRTPRAVTKTVADLVPIPPTVQRTFAGTDQVSAFVRLHQGGSGPLAPATLTVRIVDASNETVFELPRTIGSDEFDATRSHGHTIAVPIQLLKPGDHVLRIDAQMGREVSSRAVRFSVR